MSLWFFCLGPCRFFPMPIVLTQEFVESSAQFVMTRCRNRLVRTLFSLGRGVTLLICRDMRIKSRGVLLYCYSGINFFEGRPLRNFSGPSLYYTATVTPGTLDCYCITNTTVSGDIVRFVWLSSYTFYVVIYKGLKSNIISISVIHSGSGFLHLDLFTCYLVPLYFLGNYFCCVSLPV